MKRGGGGGEPTGSGLVATTPRAVESGRCGSAGNERRKGTPRPAADHSRCLLSGPLRSTTGPLSVSGAVTHSRRGSRSNETTVKQSSRNFGRNELRGERGRPVRDGSTSLFLRRSTGPFIGRVAPSVASFLSRSAPLVLTKVKGAGHHGHNGRQLPAPPLRLRPSLPVDRLGTRRRVRAEIRGVAQGRYLVFHLLRSSVRGVVQMYFAWVMTTRGGQGGVWGYVPLRRAVLTSLHPFVPPPPEKNLVPPPL